MDERTRHIATERYSEKDEALAARLSFFGKLWDLQAEIAADVPSIAAPDAETARDALATDQPLFLIDAPAIDAETFREAVRRVAALVASDSGLPDPSAQALRDTDIAGAIDQDDLDGALRDFDAFADTVAERLDTARDESVAGATVRFVLASALTPLIRASAQTVFAVVEDADWRLWSSALCPVCGTPASSGRVRDEGSLQGGRRILSCPLCRTEWEYDRLRCARCGSRSHQNLHYLHTEEDPGHRIHVCEKCKGYFKVSFERDLEIAVSPEVEEIVMLPLDEIARSRGYTELGHTDEVVAKS